MARQRGDKIVTTPPGNVEPEAIDKAEEDEGGWATKRETDDLWDSDEDGDDELVTAGADTGEHAEELPLNDERRDPTPPAEQWDIRGANEHDMKLVAFAVEERVTRLRALEKKNTDEGYLREARTIAADAARLEKGILPALSLDQAEFPTLTAVEARSGIANHLHDVIRRYVRHSEGPEDNPVEAFENEVCQRVERFGREIAEKAYAAGYAARGQHPTAFILSALEQLDHQELRDTVAAS